MAAINMILQGKGGVGKSFTASLLSQYLLDRDQLVGCFDADPVNATLTAYASLKATKIEIMEGDSINSRLFDTMIEKLLQLPDKAFAVIDSGASTFVPLAAYMSENNVAEFLKDSGHNLTLHTLITGGQAEGDTIQGLASLMNGFPDTPITIWVNPFFGQIDFENHKLAKANCDQDGTTIVLPTYKKETFGYDLELMLKSRLTFAQAINSGKFNIMAKQRLKIARDEIWNILDESGLIMEAQEQQE